MCRRRQGLVGNADLGSACNLGALRSFRENRFLITRLPLIIKAISDLRGRKKTWRLIPECIIEPGENGAPYGPVEQRIESPNDDTVRTCHRLIPGVERTHNLKKGLAVRRPKVVDDGDAEKRKGPKEACGDS